MTQSQIDKLNEIFGLISDLDDKLNDLLGYEHPLYDSIGVQLADIYTEITDNFKYNPNDPA